MAFAFSDYEASARALRGRLGGFVPELVLILGSGLGELGDRVESPTIIPYGEVPNFPVSTAPGHKGRLVFGELEGRRVAVMQGRFHYYEGWTMEQVCFPLRVLWLLGAKTLIATNAAGCVNTDWNPGDIMLISDHIKWAADSPLRGENLPRFGPRFSDCSALYTPRLRAAARAAAEEQGLPLREGVYLYLPGPQYETPAEIRAARVLGADGVGMSTAPEVIAAGHCGMEVLGFSLLTNMAAGIQSGPLDGDEVIAAAESARERFTALIRGCLARI